jgi:hypothetical protein
MEDFGIPPIDRGNWYAGKTTNDPRKRQRQQDQGDASEEPVDSVVLSSDEPGPETPEE